MAFDNFDQFEQLDQLDGRATSPDPAPGAWIPGQIISSRAGSRQLAPLDMEIVSLAVPPHPKPRVPLRTPTRPPLRVPVTAHPRARRRKEGRSRRLPLAVAGGLWLVLGACLCVGAPAVELDGTWLEPTWLEPIWLSQLITELSALL